MTLVVLALTMVAASMAGGLALSSHTERQIASAHYRAVQLGQAAEAAAETVVAAVEAHGDWALVPGTFSVGTPELDTVRDDRTADLNRSLAARYPMGSDTPRWRVVATGARGPHTTTVWIADDAADRDGRAGEDSNGRLVLRAEARSHLGAIKAIEVHLARVGAVTRRLSWREVW